MITAHHTVAVIGDGSVGKAIAKALRVTPLGPGTEPVKADVVLVCVPTPTEGGVQDLSAVTQALSRVREAKVVLLRSTVLPGTTDRLQQDSPFPLMMVPEWGFEASMEYDLANPYAYVLGTTERSAPLVPLVKQVLPRAWYYREVPSAAAEFSKYFANVWGSSQVVLANSFYDWVLSQGYGPGTYEQAVEAAKQHKNVPRWGWNIFDQGSRGYGGKCLPKDTQAAIGQYPHPLWLEFERYNNELRERP